MIIMKDIEKRINELYQYIEDLDIRCRADNTKRYELERKLDIAIETLEKLLRILRGDDK